MKAKLTRQQRNKWTPLVMLPIIPGVYFWSEGARHLGTACLALMVVLNAVLSFLGEAEEGKELPPRVLTGLGALAALAGGVWALASPARYAFAMLPVFAGLILVGIGNLFLKSEEDPAPAK